MKISLPLIAGAFTTLYAATSLAADESVETIEITGHRFSNAAAGELNAALQQQQIRFASGGGISALPVLNGMMGDRIQILADGAPITAACGNQMNPPLSYLANSPVSQLVVSPAVSPVSAGADNIAGVIAIDTMQPVFVEESDFSWREGKAAFNYSSNPNSQTFALDARLANNQWFTGYSGSITTADSYDNGADELVPDTLYKMENHDLTVGYQDAQRLAVLKFTHQQVPYQGFPGQYMDMVDNRASGLSARYQQRFKAFTVNGHLSVRNVDHEMGFFSDEKPGTMPMLTRSQDITAKLGWDIGLTPDQTLVLGQEYYANKLNDYWPAVAGSAMMGPDDYININDGRRTRSALFAQWEHRPATGWQYNVGARVEYVQTQAAQVQPYNSMPMTMSGMMKMAINDAQAAAEFNASDRDKHDTLLDVTLLAQRAVRKQHTLSFGLARKNRAPGLYERYTWGRGIMASTMIGWFGDGNGYVGNVDLTPETAHTASAGYQFENTHQKIDFTAWYTKVSDYIDITKLGELNRSGLRSGLRNQLQFTNIDATLMGVTLDTQWLLADNQWGQWQLSHTFNWQQGERDDTHDSLYQILPVENRLQLAHHYADWHSTVEWYWAGNKTDTDPRRLENTTDSYWLLNLRSSKQWADWTVEVALDNVFDRHYDLPLGGVSVAEFLQQPTQGYAQLEGPGRSVNIGVAYRF
ncbi:TonB-dependent receptor plug domain-containing protein [Salinimonas sediminis]|uniref:TonB-dependent receptor plug domain-containing protein n=1 Tax=Salinimonas sediminis TaxID=2303538 RepID=UPI00105705CB|nr:TonB-dependent receptor [Salinimonas sediminis]